MEDLNICLVQDELVWEDPEANRTHFETIFGDMAGKFDLVILPEMFTTGFTMDPVGKSERPDGPTQRWMETLATSLGSVVVGSLIIEEEGNYFNRLLAVGPGGLLVKYNKRHLFRMAGEHENYVSGQEAPIFEVKGWRISPQICYDLRFPVWSRNGQGKEGKPEYDILLYVANWPEARVSHWKTLLQARAIENQAYCLGVNRVGTDGNGFAYSGDSAAVDYMGKVLTTATGEAKLLTARLEKEGLDRYRQKFPVWQDADEFTILW